MTSPLRRLVRIAIILLSFALLFNFFGYYFTYTKSQENEKLVDIISLAERQRTLSQSISKNVVVLCRLKTYESRKQKIKANLRKDLLEFEKHDHFFRGELKIDGIPPPPGNFETTILLSRAHLHSKTIISLMSRSGI